MGAPAGARWARVSRALVEMMGAASAFDFDRAGELMAEVEGLLGRRRSSAMDEPYEQARAGVEDRDAYAVWAGAYRLICALPFGFPPALSACPPPPRASRLPAAPACAHSLPAGASFCPACGAPAG